MKVPSTRWYQGKKKTPEKEEIKQILQASRPALEILIRILEEDVDITDKKQSKEENYALPAYSEFQADCNAVKRTYKKVINLISLGE